MIPVVSSQGHALKPAYAAPLHAAQRAAQIATPETTRQSAGETAAANIRPEMAQSVDPARQAAVPARLRDEENVERTGRRGQNADTPTGPPPAFEESPLERRARVALEPPEPEPAAAAAGVAGLPDATADTGDTPESAFEAEAAAVAVPPSPAERAESGFAETRTMSAEPAPSQVDVRN